jgi:hypothetical protein
LITDQPKGLKGKGFCAVKLLAATEGKCLPWFVLETISKPEEKNAI